jgi:hypothetical protein
VSFKEVLAPVDAVPTFSDCVIGYRTWVADDEGQLWPVYSQHRPWQPGLNTARCDGGNGDPSHPAPGDSCACGLYSMRSPQSEWTGAASLRTGTLVCGAVASWGRIQVHDSGVRAEHACAVALAFPYGMTPDGMARLRRIADLYRIELAPLSELEQAASRFGSPLPGTLQPDPQQPVHRSERPAPFKRRRSLGRYSGALILLGLIAAGLALLLAFHRTAPCQVQIVSFSGAGNYESCAPPGQHGGLSYGP